MPARPNVPGVAAVVLKGAYGIDVDVVNKFYVAFTGGPLTGAQALTWATAIGNAWNTNLAAIFHPDFALESVTVEDLTSATAGAATALTSHVGTRAGNALGAATCVVLQLKIARRYRGGHPRLYLAALQGGDLLTNQQWAGASILQVQTDWANFIAAVVSGAPAGITATNQVNVSYYQGFTNHTYPSGRVRPVPNLRATPVVDIVTAISVNPKLGSQSRRNLQSA
jgi:hypothetical protein